MSFENKLPEWKNTGVEPSKTLKATGFEAGNKPPASVFNWFLSNVIKAITEIQSKACLIVNAESTDGIAYTATVPEITELTAGRMIIFIPNMTTKTDSPTLNINGLGAISIRRKMSSGTATLTKGHLTTFFYANRPSILIYDTAVSNNKYWMAMEFTQPSASDLYGYVPVQKGGTYINSETTDEDIQEALASLGAVPVTRTINGMALSADIVLAAINVGAMALTNLTRIANYADVNSYVTPGSYYCQNASVSSSLSNAPFNTGFALFVIDANGLSSYRVQLAISTDGRIVTRYTINSGATWTDWGNPHGITYGTAEPSGGKHGDIYIMYEE